ncbi:MAG: type II toxin-antitoxin system prevent-host-death family antitoxin [Deltaproteobacteria bacterium]|nr:type II toxin-antitoxin system prevent-host-death family antitoxin [Deltaproteobacteria bacterium]
MSLIVPISDLRNKTRKIVEICHEGEPVFVTRNGQGELVVMSQTLYEQMQARLELYRKLDEAEALYQEGSQGKPHATVMKNLKARLQTRTPL